jgi:hypothetical protein
MKTYGDVGASRRSLRFAAPRPYLIVRRSRQGWTVRPDIFRFTERSEYAAAQDERLPSTEPRYDLLQCNAIVVPSLTRALFDSPSPSIGYMVKASVSTREDLAMLLKLGEQIRQAYERAEGCARARRLLPT